MRVAKQQALLSNGLHSGQRSNVSVNNQLHLQEGVSADDATAGVEARVAAVRALAAVVVAVGGQVP